MIFCPHGTRRGKIVFTTCCWSPVLHGQPGQYPRRNFLSRDLESRHDARPFYFCKEKKSTIAVTRSGVLWHGMGVRGNAHVSGLSQGNAYMLWVRTFVERALVGVFGPGRRRRAKAPAALRVGESIPSHLWRTEAILANEWRGEVRSA